MTHLLALALLGSTWSTRITPGASPKPPPPTRLSTPIELDRVATPCDGPSTRGRSWRGRAGRPPGQDRPRRGDRPPRGRARGGADDPGHGLRHGLADQAGRHGDLGDDPGSRESSTSTTDHDVPARVRQPRQGSRSPSRSAPPPRRADPRQPDGRLRRRPGGGLETDRRDRPQSAAGRAVPLHRRRLPDPRPVVERVSGSRSTNSPGRTCSVLSAWMTPASGRSTAGFEARPDRPDRAGRWRDCSGAWSTTPGRGPWAAWRGTPACSRTADDLAIYAQTLLNGGVGPEGTRILAPPTVRAMIDPAGTPEGERRGLGWDVATATAPPAATGSARAASATPDSRERASGSIPSPRRS